MAGTITHEWTGSVLSVTSDSGTTSADLKGPQGETGPRGPQGPAGVIYNADGELVVDLSPFATTEYVDDAVSNVEVDLTGYATEDFVNVQIAKAQIPEAEAQLDQFVTRSELAPILSAEFYTKEEIDSLLNITSAEGVEY